MAHSPSDPSDPFEDLLASRRLPGGELDSGEFATDLINVAPPRRGADEAAARRELPGPLYSRGEWSPLRRAWLCLQIALAAGAAASYLYLNDFALGLIAPCVAAAVSSLSLGLLLLARSSAVYEIRTLTRDRQRLREQTSAFAHYTEYMTECISHVATGKIDFRHAGAPMVRDLLEHGRRSLACGGHEEIALLVLRREADRCFLTYSSGPEHLHLALVRTGYPIEDGVLESCRESSVATHTVDFRLGGHRQELLALSSRSFRRCDRLAIEQLAACLSLVAAPGLAHE
jgi:hypothetical protein